MFAFSLWDKCTKQLTLARDRIGEKPLFYGCIDHILYFSSELKSIRAACPTTPSVNKQALAYMLRYGYVPSPYTIYDGVFKLPPGTYLQFNSTLKLNSPISWWSLSNVIQTTSHSPIDLSFDDSVDSFSNILSSSVSRCMEADVPVACLLSGGIDSSLIASVMQSISNKPIQSYTIGFESREFNEADMHLLSLLTLVLTILN